MSKMQSVSFRNISEFLEFLPEDELAITERLRKIVFSCIPDISEKLSYNVPFYKYHKTICFIWPASVLWGRKKTYSGVRLGFSNGYLLSDENGYLQKGNRKFVYWKDFRSTREIDTELVRAFLFEALVIDEQSGKSK